MDVNNLRHFTETKWGRSSSSQYPENQPTKLYGMEYDQINPSRSDPGYLVLDLKKLAQGHLKFHEQQLSGGKRRRLEPKAPPTEQRYKTYNSPGQYPYQQYNYNAYQPNYQNYQQQNYQQQNNYQQKNYQQQNYQPPYEIQG